MKVTDVRLNLINTDTAVKAIGSFTLDEVFVVRGIRLMEDKNGNVFTAFPSREKQDGNYEDIAFPLTRKLYADITKAVLEEYQQLIQLPKKTQDEVEMEME